MQEKERRRKYKREIMREKTKKIITCTVPLGSTKGNKILILQPKASICETAHFPILIRQQSHDSHMMTERLTNRKEGHREEEMKRRETLIL